MLCNFFKFFLLIFVVLLASCSNNKKQTIEPKKTIELNILYKEAYKNFNSGNYNEAVRLFELVEKDYSYTEWAAKAMLMRSFLYYDAGKYLDALVNLQRFKKRHPGNKNIIYAEYLIGMCMFEQINFASLSQEHTTLALQQFKKIIANFPNTPYAADAKFKIDLIHEQFAAKEMYLARYYAKRQKWIPALYRLDNILKNYQTTVFVEEALHRLVEINYKIGNISSAKKYASILGYNYNDSDWYKKSYNIVEGANIPLEKAKQKKSIKEIIKKIIKIQ